MDSDKVSLGFRVSKELKERYIIMYPQTLARFLENCIELSLDNKKFFEYIYFKEYRDGVAMA